jgi:sec-independent protein translocase protein TatB
MFEVGFQELVLIALLALIVLGPEKLPKLAANLGRWTGRARSMARNLRQQLENEVSYEDLMKQKQAAEEALRRATEAPMNFHEDLDRQVKSTLDEAEASTAQASEVPAASLESPVVADAAVTEPAIHQPTAKADPSA